MWIVKIALKAPYTFTVLAIFADDWRRAQRVAMKVNNLDDDCRGLTRRQLREMHWHPNADEWQFYFSGRARITVFGAHGRTKTEAFGPGGVAFIKQGFGHFVEQIGDEAIKVPILLKSPVYEEINISTWLGANPLGIITDNFGISRELADKLPGKSIVIATAQVGLSSST